MQEKNTQIKQHNFISSNFVVSVTFFCLTPYLSIMSLMITNDVEQSAIMTVFFPSFPNSHKANARMAHVFNKAMSDSSQNPTPCCYYC